MSRLYGDKENIDGDRVKDFFNERANKDVDSNLSIVLFQDKENSEQRHLEEKKLFHKYIDVSGKKVLELGCGIGRWAEALYDKCEYYLGIDFSENLLDIANKTYADKENCKFQLMSVTDIKVDELLVEPPFDVIIISGVLMYLNDDDLRVVVDYMNQLGSEDKKIFIMEPTSCMDSRLTLKDFYSEGLEVDYSAIYRTKDEYLEFFEPLNYNSVIVDNIFTDLSDHSETNYKFFVFE